MSAPIVRSARRLAAALAALVLAAPAAAQQTGVIEGTVVSAPGAEPVAGATVRIDPSRGAVTDAAGRFRIASLPAGTYTLIARRVGYADVTVSAEVCAGATATVRIRLTEESLLLEGMTVVSATEHRVRARRRPHAAERDAVRPLELDGTAPQRVARLRSHRLHHGAPLAGRAGALARGTGRAADAGDRNPHL